MEHPIRYAAITKNWKIILRLLEFNYFNVDFRPEVTDDEPEEIKYFKSITALLFAVEDNNLEVVQALLQAGANPEIKDLDGYCALSYAAVNNSKGSIINLLLKYIKKDPYEIQFSIFKL